MALPDAAQTWNFDLIFPFIPGANDSQTLTVRCKTTSLPGSKIEGIDIELHGVKKREAGRAQYDHTFTFMLMETVGFDSYTKLRQWRDRTRSWKNNTGADSAEYKVNAELDLYDNQGNTTKTIVINGCWLEEIANVDFNGAESAGVEISATLSFDFLDDGVSY
jgi:hypothetical protein